MLSNHKTRVNHLALPTGEVIISPSVSLSLSLSLTHFLWVKKLKGHYHTA